MLTQEKANALAEYLNADEDRAKKVVEMGAADAVEALKKDGLEFTAEELAEFAEAVEKAQKTGELGEAELEGVSGGVMTLIPIFLIGVGIVWRWIRR